MAVSIMMKGNYEIIIPNSSYNTVKMLIRENPGCTWLTLRGNLLKTENILVIREIKK